MGGPVGRRAALTTFLDAETDRPLDLILLSHRHEDHLGGLVAAVHHRGARLFLDAPVPHPGPAYTALMHELEDRQVVVRQATRGRRIDLGGGAVMTLLGPPDPPITGSRSDVNANSVVARLSYGKFAVLFTGDAEAPTEQWLLAAGAPVQATVLKVAHHGSRYASRVGFLRAGRRADRGGQRGRPQRVPPPGARDAGAPRAQRRACLSYRRGRHGDAGDRRRDVAAAHDARAARAVGAAVSAKGGAKKSAKVGAKPARAATSDPGAAAALRRRRRGRARAPAVRPRRFRGAGGAASARRARGELASLVDGARAGAARRRAGQRAAREARPRRRRRRHRSLSAPSCGMCLRPLAGRPRAPRSSRARRRARDTSWRPSETASSARRAARARRRSAARACGRRRANPLRTP